MSTFAENDFDIVAPIYDGLATLTFAGAIRRAQISLLPRVAHADSALVIGGGTGWFLLELLERTTVRRVVYVEKSESMLRKSQQLIQKRRPEWLGRVDFRLGTEETLNPNDGPFSLVVTNFFLACFDDQNCARMIEGLYRWLAPEGHWLFVDFHYPERGWQRLSANVLFKVMFTFFNVFSNLEAKRPPKYELGFDRTGLKIAQEQTFYARMIRARLLARG